MTPSAGRDLLESFPSRRVGVVGDFLLDQYIIGNSGRVSREAPIVVVDYLDTINHPGGAANAAQNIAALGATCAAIGVVGEDREGEALTELLSKRGVDISSVITDGAAATSVKLRIMAGELNAQKQQVARVDRSHRLSLNAALRERLDVMLSKVTDGCDAVLISDYGMGLVPGDLSRNLIERCNARGIPVVVDSRFSVTAYSGATAATPNEVEALAALRLTDESALMSAAAAARLTAESGINGFVVTRGSKGMLVLDGDHAPESIGIAGSDQATDVTGAGDTVSAVVALALASGCSLCDAARMATYAAAVVVMKRGTATASRQEILAVMERHAGTV